MYHDCMTVWIFVAPVKNNLSLKIGGPIFLSSTLYKNKSKCVSGVVQGAGPNVEVGRIWPVGHSLGTTALRLQKEENYTSVQTIYLQPKITMFSSLGFVISRDILRCSNISVPFN